MCEPNVDGVISPVLAFLRLVYFWLAENLQTVLCCEFLLFFFFFFQMKWRVHFLFPSRKVFCQKGNKLMKMMLKDEFLVQSN